MKKRHLSLDGLTIEGAQRLGIALIRLCPGDTLSVDIPNATPIPCTLTVTMKPHEE